MLKKKGQIFMLFSKNIPDGIATRMPLQITEWSSTSSGPPPIQAHLGGRALHQSIALGYLLKNCSCTELWRQISWGTSLQTLWPHPYDLCVLQPRYSRCPSHDHPSTPVEFLRANKVTSMNLGTDASCILKTPNSKRHLRCILTL